MNIGFVTFVFFFYFFLLSGKMEKFCMVTEKKFVLKHIFFENFFLITLLATLIDEVIIYNQWTQKATFEISEYR